MVLFNWINIWNKASELNAFKRVGKVREDATV